MKQLKNFGIIPFTRGALTQMLKEYSSPNDKISSWLANGDIISLKKGLYVVSEMHREQKLNLEIIANQIYGPSYVSLDWALQFYGVIPEKVNVNIRLHQEIEEF
jgi:predicted transcriptional regulator of viral defense system